MNRDLAGLGRSALEAILDRVNRIWASIVGVGAFVSPKALAMTEEEFQAERNAVFDGAKRASDFVGMIVRLAFLQFAFLYFLKESPKTEGIAGFALGMCAISCLGLSVYMARAIVRIIFLWEIRDVRSNRWAWMKVVLFTFALASTLCIYFAVMHLVGAIASSNALIAAT